MADRRSREKRKARTVNIDRRMKDHKTGFEKTTFRVPEGMSFFSPKKPGVYRLEIVPFEVTEAIRKFHKDVVFADPGDFYYEQTYWAHQRIGPNNDAYVCPAKQCGKKCPICEHRAREANKPDGDEDLIKSLAPKQRQLFCVYDHADPDKGVQLWEISYHLFGKHLENKIKNADEEDRESYMKFCDEEDGKTLRVTATEEPNPSGKHLEFADIEFKDRKDALDADLYDNAPSLDKLITVLDYEALKKAFLMTPEDDTDDTDDDDDEKAQADDDDDENDDEPKPARKTNKTAQVDDDDDTEFDLDPDVEVGDEVFHKKYGKCKITKISGDGASMTLKDGAGDFHKAISPTEVRKAPPEEEKTAPKAKDQKTSAKSSDSAKSDADDDDDEFMDSDLEASGDDDEEDDPKPAKSGKKSESFQKDDDDDEFMDSDLDDDPPAKSNGKAASGKKTSKK